MSDPKAEQEAESAESDPQSSEKDSKAIDQPSVQALLSNPALIKTVQDQLGSLVGSSSGYIESLPDAVKRRLKALKNLQVDSLKVQAKFYEEVHTLEAKYQSQCRVIEEKRANVISGKYEPTDEECQWDLDEEEEEEEGEPKTEKMPCPFPEDVKGIPEFWLTAMKNVDNLAEMILEHDEPILKHLTDIELVYTVEPLGFVLKFYFEPNEFFSETVLTKTYEVKSEINPEDPFSFDGPEVAKSNGCKISWNKGKNVTVKTVKKRQKHKGHGQSRVVTKQLKVDSFFNFFSPPQIPSDHEAEEIDDNLEGLALDYELGLFFRDRFIAKAVLFFTGDIIDDEDLEEDMDEEDDDYDEDEGEEGDPDFKPAKNGGGKPQECKQQ